MPIRFRCAFCNQLMAISRRKAGKVVRCPKCAGDIIVPGTDDRPAGDPPHPGFDDPNFAAALDRAEQQSPTVKAPAPSPPSTDFPSPTQSVARRGIFLSPGRMALVLGINLLFLILAFVIGLIVGKSMAD